MSDTKFFTEIDKMFEGYLSAKADKLQLRIKDVGKNLILEESNKMNYSKVLFDSELNIYKIEDGKIVRVENENFEVVVVKEQ